MAQISEEALKNILSHAFDAVMSRGTKGRKLFIKGIARVDKFAGGDEAWRSWSDDVRMTVRSSAPELALAMQKIERGEESETELGEQHELARDAAELFEILHGLTDGGAKLIIREAAQGDGLRAWWLFAGQYAKQTLAKVLRMHREGLNLR